MKKNQRIINIARKKIHKSSSCNQLCGYLTYIEIVQIAEHGGLKLIDYYERSWMPYYQEHIKKGDIKSTWVYFQPNRKWFNEISDSNR